MLPVDVVIPVLNASATVEAVVASVRPWAQEIIVVDGGSGDGTVNVAERAGARVVSSGPGRGLQLATGAGEASRDWLLFLHGDTVLEKGWVEQVSHFIGTPDNRSRAAAFRLVLDDGARAARRLERIVAWRCRVFGLPYGDQGLLISRELYDRLGGFRPIPLFEDVDMVRRIGRDRLVMLGSAAITSAERYRRNGFVLRPLRNILLLAAYFTGVPPRFLYRMYG